MICPNLPSTNFTNELKNKDMGLIREIPFYLRTNAVSKISAGLNSRI